MAYGAGVTLLPGLVGNIRIPRLAGGAAHEWLPEAGAASDQQANFDTIAMSPKTIVVSIPITRRLLLQSAPAVGSCTSDSLKPLAAVIAGPGQCLRPVPKGLSMAARLRFQPAPPIMF
ncbi:hypothetical protein EOK75_12405 (plasmid) [Pseudorhodobacter turbinis]|uniref:Phage capsid-like C-terminal domain-containing protein n=1 Tax=Pseudorhodobacter turbinis TaxID=2500533 RepID=A0A4V1E122_9RHOB|nr:phage major capsid protein [Pseudorhodobacter turbinis]QCO56624.1 hypothetical protein EOK75_12405 [Pseudorhodobacter turbinis]